jgi:asparaginyl-tRNA synthetase
MPSPPSPVASFAPCRGQPPIVEQTEFSRSLIGSTLKECADDMADLNQWLDKGIIETLEHVVESDDLRLTYTDAIAELEKSGQSFEYPVKWGIDMQVRARALPHRDHLQVAGDRHRLPEGHQSLLYETRVAMKRPSAPWTCWCRGLGRSSGACDRESRYDVLLKRIRKMDLPEEHYWC